MAAEAYAIGVDIGGTKTAVTLWTLQGKLLAKRRFATEGESAEVIEKICDTIDATLSESGVELSAVAGIGVSCGGPLDSSRGLVLSPPNLSSWDSVPIAGILAKKTGRPCYLENDANACALAEWYWGAGRGCQSMRGYLRGLSSPSGTERIMAFLEAPVSNSAGQTRFPTFSRKTQSRPSVSSPKRPCLVISASRWHMRGLTMGLMRIVAYHREHEAR